jgi:flagellar biosynthesis/type III secretory pathway M-ring protein FliF/YscJ
MFIWPIGTVPPLDNPIEIRMGLMRVLLICLLFVTPSTGRAQAVSDDYARYLQEYDRRLEEQRPLADQQDRRGWGITTPVGAFLVILFISAQVAVRRRFRRVQALNQKPLALVEQSVQQNQRMIELLESIDRKLDKPEP